MSDPPTVDTLRSLTENIVKMRELRDRELKKLAEMEYVLYVRYLWELTGEEFDLSTSYTARYEHWTHNKNFIVLRRKDGTEIKYPVRVKYMSFSGATDIWDDGKIPERFIELLYEQQRTNSDLGSIHAYRKLRDKRLADEETFKETYGHYRSKAPCVGVVKVEPSGNIVQLDDAGTDGGLSEVEDQQGVEGS